MARSRCLLVAVMLVGLASAACSSPCQNYCERKLKQDLVDNFGVSEDEACNSPGMSIAMTCPACAQALRDEYAVTPVEPMCGPTGAFND